ncbi:MAG: hypothetical protein J0H39_19560 [Alphaproteobacteria bacterium]|jgi:hypothetical protein|nr:hypothetical protein [Alphaproteobacteria bacterium]
MNVLSLIFRELVGLFVDDEFLAVAILAVIAGCGVMAAYTDIAALVIGVILLAGCVLVLLASVARGSRRIRR